MKKEKMRNLSISKLEESKLQAIIGGKVCKLAACTDNAMDKNYFAYRYHGIDIPEDLEQL